MSVRRGDDGATVADEGPGERYARPQAIGRPQYLTTVRTLYVEGRKNFRVLFGAPARIETEAQREGYTQRKISFIPGARFALDLWICNAYGTVQWRSFVCEAIGPHEEGNRVPSVSPAARILLSTQGAAQSRLFLAWLRALEEGGTDVLKCPKETFEAAHFRLQGSRADRIPAHRLSGLL